jgi:type IV fimbrial biogenesis protein FimT
VLVMRAAPVRPPSTASGGFTLLELMTVLAVVAILGAVAAPSFRQFIDNQRLRNASFDLVTDLLLARSEAVSRQRTVVLSPSGTNGGAWTDGWSLNQDTAGGAVLTSRTGVAPRLRFSVANSSAVALSNLAFRNDGRINALTPITIQVTYSTTIPGVSCSVIRIDATGRARADKAVCP